MIIKNKIPNDKVYEGAFYRISSSEVSIIYSYPTAPRSKHTINLDRPPETYIDLNQWNDRPISRKKYAGITFSQIPLNALAGETYYFFFPLTPERLDGREQGELMFNCTLLPDFLELGHAEINGNSIGTIMGAPEVDERSATGRFRITTKYLDYANQVKYDVYEDHTVNWVLFDGDIDPTEKDETLKKDSITPPIIDQTALEDEVVKVFGSLLDGINLLQEIDPINRILNEIQANTFGDDVYFVR